MFELQSAFFQVKKWILDHQVEPTTRKGVPEKLFEEIRK